MSGVECENHAQPHARTWLRGLHLAHEARRCGARCRSGLSCRGPAMKNGRCRMHGGRSPGAPTGSRNGRYRHGRFTIGTKAMMTEVRRLTRALAGLCGNGRGADSP